MNILKKYDHIDIDIVRKSIIDDDVCIFEWAVKNDYFVQDIHYNLLKSRSDFNMKNRKIANMALQKNNIKLFCTAIEHNCEFKISINALRHLLDAKLYEKYGKCFIINDHNMNEKLLLFGMLLNSENYDLYVYAIKFCQTNINQNVFDLVKNMTKQSGKEIVINLMLQEGMFDIVDRCLC